MEEKINKIKIKNLFYSIFCFLIVFLGCHKKDTSNLLVYCGAGISPPISEIIEIFGKGNNVKIECIYNASNLLFGQIKLTHQGDIFIPGDIFYVKQAENEGLIGDIRIAAYFIPVIIVQKGNPKQIKSIIDLDRKGMRLGIGDKRFCAIGAKTERIFQKNNISLKDIENNTVFTSTTVNELGDAVKLGHIDAAIVWDAIARYYSDDCDIIDIPVKQNIISKIPIAVLSFSTNRSLSKSFLEFAVSEKAKKIFIKHNYTINLKECM